MFEFAQFTFVKIYFTNSKSVINREKKNLSKIQIKFYKTQNVDNVVVFKFKKNLMKIVVWFEFDEKNRKTLKKNDKKRMFDARIENDNHDNAIE
jgi:hypothetical protein